MGSRKKKNPQEKDLMIILMMMNNNKQMNSIMNSKTLSLKNQMMMCSKIL